MRAFLLGLTACLVVSEVFGQFISDGAQNPVEQIERSRVRTKVGQCVTLGFDYYVFVRNEGGVSLNFVDRNFYTVNGLQRPCAPGTLFSVESTMCICSDIIVNNNQPRFFTNRCSRITGDFQSQTPFRNNRMDNNGNDFPIDTGITIPETSSLIDVGNCLSTRWSTPMSYPHYRGNNVARSSFDIRIGFSVPVGADVGIYKIISNSPCEADADAPSFELSYVESAGGQRSIVLSARLQSSYNTRLFTSESSYSITCTINGIARAGLQTLTWSEGDATNYVRIVGNPSNFNAATIIVGNSQVQDGDLGVNSIPATGFCSTRTTSGNFPRFRRGGLVFAIRSCNLMFAQAPENVAVPNANNAMCAYSLSMTTDC